MNTTTITRSAAQSGRTRVAMHRAAQRGQMTRIARGIYLPSNSLSIDWDLLEAAARRPEATICLTSALAYHDLTDEIPSQLDIAMHRGGRLPVGRGAIAWHTFHRGTFNLGRTEIPIEGSDRKIGLYSPERSIADAFRLRGQVGYELATHALKEWLRRGGKPAQILPYALKLPQAKAPLIAALQTLT